MSILTENGTGIVGANSYSGVGQADAFHLLRANVAWGEADETSKVAALVRATDYIDATYRAPAARANPDQGLQWPTEGATALPAAIVAATHVLALYALTGPLIAPAVRGIKASKESLDGVASEETTYDDLAPVDPYPAVTSMLIGVATVRGQSSGGVRIQRLVR